jgi:uncharacterized membrane protein
LLSVTALSVPRSVSPSSKREADSQAQVGVGGYSGLQILGNVPITVGSRTGIHTVMLSEEPHFDIILGRAWIEKMNIK